MNKGFQKGNTLGRKNKGRKPKPQQGFQKGNKLFDNPKAVATRFKKGQKPWVAGKKATWAKDLPQKFKRGQRPWNYRGVTPLRQLVRHCFEYRLWISDVFKRDDYTCQHCNLRGVYLEAHHIKTFASIFEEYEINTMQKAIECIELWNINNGLTLCRDCHNKTKNGNGKH